MNVNRIAGALGVFAALALVGCPLPQPLPDYPAGSVTPPRIIAATTTRGSESLITVPASCPTGPHYDLDALIFYPDNLTLDARWFVDYRIDQASRYAIQNMNGITEVPANGDPTVLQRPVPTFTFRPYEYPPPAELGIGSDPKAAGVVHVVELVVSNGFDTSPTATEPNRTPAITDGGGRFEIQTYRWVFVLTNAISCP